MTARAGTPDELHQLFIKAFDTSDMELLLSLYEPTATVVTPEGKLATGPAAIRAMMEQFMALKPRFTMQITSLATAENVALVRNRWTLDATGPDGEPVSMNGTAFEVMRRQADGTWLWLIDQPFAA